MPLLSIPHKVLPEIYEDKALRIEYFKYDFFAFCLYYFSESFRDQSDGKIYPASDFQRSFCVSLSQPVNVLCVAHRDSAKTMFAKYKIVHNICYKMRRYQMYFCYDKKNAAAKLFDVAIQLQTNKRLIADFGQLYYNSELEDKHSKKKSIGDFITSNFVKVEASGIGESPRGKNYEPPDGGVYRPDFAVFDDIEVNKSVMNEKIIDKNYQWLKSETFYALGRGCKKVILGNVILLDGLVPRLVVDYQDHKARHTYRIPAVYPDGTPTWSRNTAKYLEEQRNEGEVFYNQNMLLIPYEGKNALVKRKRIIYKKWKDRIEEHGKDGYTVEIGLDTGISESEGSDRVGIVASLISNDRKYKHVVEAIPLEGPQKEVTNQIAVVGELFDRRNGTYVKNENVQFQKVMEKLLLDAGIPAIGIVPHTDKVSRFLPFQRDFELGYVTFEEGYTEELVSELIYFPNGRYKDLVDAMVYSFWEGEYWSHAV